MQQRKFLKRNNSAKHFLLIYSLYINNFRHKLFLFFLLFHYKFFFIFVKINEQIKNNFEGFFFFIYFAEIYSVNLFTALKLSTTTSGIPGPSANLNPPTDMLLFFNKSSFNMVLISLFMSL